MFCKIEKTRTSDIISQIWTKAGTAKGMGRAKSNLRFQLDRRPQNELMVLTYT